MTLSTAWFEGVSEDKKKDTEDSIKHSTIVLRQLKKILEKQITSLDRTTLEDYETPSWAYKEADRLGQLRAYRKILALIPN